MAEAAHDHHAPGDASGTGMQAAMASMDRGMRTMSGNPDPHARQLAEEIIAAQQAEIAAMQGRLAILRRGGDAGELPALGGTRGPAR